MIHLDSSFVVDLSRELRRGQAGPAQACLARAGDETVAISLFVLCELAAGADLADQPAREHARLEDLYEPWEVIHPDERFPRRYGQIASHLERRGQQIGVMDLLIATTAVLEDAALVTRNEREFRRIPGLRVISY